MRNWISALISKFGHLSHASTSTPCPNLEQLEDRCMPSANMMMPMPMTMPMMAAQPMSTGTVSNQVSPSTLAAITKLFEDFDQTLRQVESSTTMQQFITNEIHMIQVLAADLAQINMVGPMRGPMM